MRLHYPMREKKNHTLSPDLLKNRILHKVWPTSSDRWVITLILWPIVGLNFIFLFCIPLIILEKSQLVCCSFFHVGYKFTRETVFTAAEHAEELLITEFINRNYATTLSWWKKILSMGTGTWNGDTWALLHQLHHLNPEIVTRRAVGTLRSKH